MREIFILKSTVGHASQNNSGKWHQSCDPVYNLSSGAWLWCLPVSHDEPVKPSLQPQRHDGGLVYSIREQWPSLRHGLLVQTS